MSTLSPLSTKPAAFIPAPVFKSVPAGSTSKAATPSATERQVAQHQVDGFTSSAAAAGVSPLLADKATANRVFQKTWSDYKKDHLTSKGTSGGNQLRPLFDKGAGTTVSEGIGYSMLGAVMAGDKGTFQKLWNYGKSHLNDRGLMAWMIGPDGKTPPRGDGKRDSASDADQDIAMALMLADKKFGGFRKDATKMIDNMLKHDVDAKTKIFKNGDTWNTEKINPSYMAPGYYKAFAQYTGNKAWDQVADKAYEVLNNASRNSEIGKKGLLPNWARPDGGPTSANNPGQPDLDPNSYGYESVRAPWRLATDAAWTGDKRAVGLLNKMNNFWKDQGGPEKIRAVYDSKGRPVHDYSNQAFLATAAAGAIVDKSKSFRDSAWKVAANGKPENYFNDSLRLVSMGLLAGKMTDLVK